MWRYYSLRLGETLANTAAREWEILNPFLQSAQKSASLVGRASEAQKH